MSIMMSVMCIKHAFIDISFTYSMFDGVAAILLCSIASIESDYEEALRSLELAPSNLEMYVYIHRRHV